MPIHTAQVITSSSPASKPPSSSTSTSQP
jgi:hypothetical protein